MVEDHFCVWCGLCQIDDVDYDTTQYLCSKCTSLFSRLDEDKIKQIYASCVELELNHKVEFLEERFEYLKGEAVNVRETIKQRNLRRGVDGDTGSEQGNSVQTEKKQRTSKRNLSSRKKGLSRSQRRRMAIQKPSVDKLIEKMVSECPF